MAHHEVDPVGQNPSNGTGTDWFLIFLKMFSKLSVKVFLTQFAYQEPQIFSLENWF